jgi:hypothetical protein
MRKTRLIRERCSTLRSITGAIESVWMQKKGYYTYYLFFETSDIADSKKEIVLLKYPDVWVENIGVVKMECQDEFQPYFLVEGYVLEVTFLE